MRLRFTPGVQSDAAPVAPPDDLRIVRANNWRWRRSRSGTDGLFLETVGPCYAVATALPDEPFAFSDAFSTDFDRGVYPSSQVQLAYAPHTLRHVSLASGPGTLVMGLNRVDLLTPDAASTPIAPIFDIAASALWTLPAETPAYAATATALPAWWAVEDYDLVIAGHIGAGPVYAWGKDPAVPFAVLDAGAPVGAVGAAISNRILVLLGVEGVVAGLGPLTIRWSDRFDFPEFTPSDLTLSGELVLEIGSRIVGGGMTSFGVAAWTDRVLALLNETGDNSVFAREYVRGSTGLLGPRAWCESAGEIWWLDPDWNLWRYDGGRPRMVPCPLFDATLGPSADVSQAAWVELVSAPAYDEVWIAYRNGTAGAGANRTLIYNHAIDAWYPATFFARPERRASDLFTGFAHAAAGLPIMSAFRAGADLYVLSMHDLPDMVDDAYAVFDGDSHGTAAVLCRPWGHFLETAPFVLTEDAQDQTARSTDMHLDARVNPLPGFVPWQFACDPCAKDPSPQMQVTLRGLRRGARTFETVHSERRPWSEPLPGIACRVAGRYLQLRIEHGGADRDMPIASGRVRLGGVWMNAVQGGKR